MRGSGQRKSYRVPEMLTTRVFEDVLQAWIDRKRGILLEGGTRSTKTYSVMQFLHVVSGAAKSPLLTSVISESLPHLKLGAIRDYFNVLGLSQANDPQWSRTDFIRKYPNALIEFWGADNAGKASGPSRDILFVNEGNYVPWSTVHAAATRTTKFVIVDWNPTGEFWAHQYESDGKIVSGWRSDPRFAYSHSTYLDAKAVLPRSVVEEIESNRDKDPNWWNIYGLGLTGKIEGLVHPKFEQIDALPTGAGGYGLDLGYSGDPVALVQNVIIGGNLYSRELIYERNLTNDDIARQMTVLGVDRRSPIYADAAEPKSIEELVRKGFNVMASEKGPGSVAYGIQRVNQYYQYWTKDSPNCIREQRNYRYDKDRITGTLKDSTDNAHQYSHGMDARRYFVASYRHAATGFVSSRGR